MWSIDVLITQFRILKIQFQSLNNNKQTLKKDFDIATNINFIRDFLNRHVKLQISKNVVKYKLC